MAIALKLAQDNVPSKKGRPPEKEAFIPEKGLAVSPSQPPPLVGAGHSVLVVDDNPVILRAFELKLRGMGFNVITTPNCAAVASTAEKEKSEIILLDINFTSGADMDWSGFTVMQWLQRFPELVNVPVIVITGGDSSRDKEKAIAAGAAAFFHKPVDFKELVAVILKVLGDKAKSATTPVC